MVVVPLAALGWLGWRLVTQNEAVATVEVETLLEGRLQDIDGSVSRFMAERQRVLLDIATRAPKGVKALRAFRNALPNDYAVIAVDGEGRVQFPPLGEAMSLDERQALERMRTVWEGTALPSAAKIAGAGDPPRTHGWLRFYHGGGLNLLLWHVQGSRIVAVELTRIDLLSDLVAYLPATETDSSAGASHRTTLEDASGSPVYQWGRYTPPDGEAPQAAWPLAAPLGAWRLQHYSVPSDIPGTLRKALTFNLGIGLAGVALALFLIVVLLYRMRTREMRVAAQRVTFVNQVSHELKTPLTNIRLYAELLANDLDIDPDDRDDDDPLARRVRVITEESARLSRLITNVLSFARQQEGKLRVSRAPLVVDAVVRRTVATLTPSLDAAGITVALTLDASAEVMADADAIEQVLANLLSNVEKYARVGGAATITTRQGTKETVITVTDRGPGIPQNQRDRVFDPFVRLDDQLSEGVSGTGIGLDIARRLARLHGGDLRVVDSTVGACFELIIATERRLNER
ncbi:MAG: signal transduction histidine kinase, partial [Myxococcota bacterium]